MVLNGPFYRLSVKRAASYWLCSMTINKLIDIVKRFDVMYDTKSLLISGF